MAAQIKKGTWVEVRNVVLRPDERAPQIPEDTRQVPLEMRARGFLAGPASPGQEAEIITTTGRHLRGILDGEPPAYNHGFGAPVAELLTIGNEVRALLAERGEST